MIGYLIFCFFFQFTIFNKDGRGTHLPKLITTPESSQFELSLENLELDLHDENLSELVLSKLLLKYLYFMFFMNYPLSKPKYLKT